MAIITDSSDRPSTAAIPMAKSRPGMDSMMSVMRMTSASTQPPKAPARRPTAMPTEAPSRSDTTPTSSDCRAP